MASTQAGHTNRALRGAGVASAVAALSALLAAELATAGLRRAPATPAPGARRFFRACTCGVSLDLAAAERTHAALDRAWRGHARQGCKDMSEAAALELRGDRTAAGVVASLGTWVRS